jgi:hypothetical protein
VTQGAAEPANRGTAEANAGVSQNAGGTSPGYTLVSRYAFRHVSLGAVTTSSFSGDTTSTSTGVVVHGYFGDGTNPDPPGAEPDDGAQHTGGVYAQVTGGEIQTPAGTTRTVTGTVTPAYSVDLGFLGIDVNAVGIATNAYQLADPSSTLLRHGVVGGGGSVALTLKADSGYSGFMVEGYYSRLHGLGDASSGTTTADVNRGGVNVGGFHNFTIDPRNLLFFGVTGGVSVESGQIQDPAATRGAALPPPRSYNVPTIGISATVGWSFF